MSSRAAPQEVAAAAAAAAAGTAGAVQQERGPTGAFPLVLKRLMENPPRDAPLGEGGGSVSASPVSRLAQPPILSWWVK
uniref:Uncharacterized protein n=1 Tax=Pseudonaja textilis TaxID=8673 RepID=A0A670XTQ3_PSETE